MKFFEPFSTTFMLLLKNEFPKNEEFLFKQNFQYLEFGKEQNWKRTEIGKEQNFQINEKMIEFSLYFHLHFHFHRNCNLF